MARVGLIGENSIEYINKLIDIWNNGNCAVLTDWRIPFQTTYEMMKEASVGTSFSNSGKRIFINLETDVLRLVRSLILSNLYFVSEYSSESWYNMFVQGLRLTSDRIYCQK